MIKIVVCYIYGPKFTRTLNHQERCEVCGRSRVKHGKRYQL